MITIYAFQANKMDDFGSAILEQSQFLEVQKTREYWTGYLTVFGSMPATLHFTRDEAMDFLSLLEDEGVETDSVVVQPVSLPPLEKFIKYFLNTHKGKETSLEFTREKPE